jgi:ketosteroid isomerase-like protein
MQRFSQVLVIALLILAPFRVFAGPSEDVASAVDHWAMAFNANDVNALIKLYAPDAALIGAAGSTVIEGSEAIRKYYSRLEKSGDISRFGTHRCAVALEVAMASSEIS